MISIATYVCHRLMTKFLSNSFENYPAVLNLICVHDCACAFVRPFLNLNYQIFKLRQNLLLKNQSALTSQHLNQIVKLVFTVNTISLK